MIEKYIEKYIIRQVKLTEYLLDMKTLNINDVATKLHVNSNTLKRDFQKICTFLEDHILNSSFTSKEICITFHTGTNYYSLVKKLYKDSKILRVCTRYLTGESNYLDIVDKEYVSVTKAFHLKKKVEDFFINSNIMNEDKEFIDNEINFRLVVLSIWMRSDLFNESIETEYMETAKVICDCVFNDFSNNHEIDERDYTLFLFATYLSLTRKDKNIKISFPLDYYEKIVNSSFTFEKINSINKQILKESMLSSDEIIFLCFMYKAVSLNTDNYLMIETNYWIERNFTIENNPIVKQLIRKFEYEFRTVLLNEISFEKPFLTFINSIWRNIQSFIVDKHYYLTPDQIDCIHRVNKVLKEWTQEFNLSSVQFNSISIEKFCAQITTTLLKKQEKKTIFIIVAKDELSHILYRENLKRWINPEFNTIDTIMYYDLASIPIYVQSLPHIIICDRALLTNQKNDNLFPFSVPTLKKDLKKLLFNIIEKS
ncbi:hypothetical protein FI616_000513 [Enterococcus faecalis]|nr:hypothetical protein [Enterococcus faecalis]